MKCNLCGQPTNGFLELYHPECIDLLKGEWDVVTKVLDAYEGGSIDAITAKQKLLLAIAEESLQKYFWSCTFPRASIPADTHLLYAHDLVECSEEKNRCKMVRTGLSYAKHPVWNSVPVSLHDVTSFVLTYTGVFLLGFKDIFIPYKKIVNVGTELSFFKLSVFFDVKTTSHDPHRYRIWGTVSKDSQFAVDSSRIIRLMTNS